MKARHRAKVSIFLLFTNRLDGRFRMVRSERMAGIELRRHFSVPVYTGTLPEFEELRAGLVDLGLSLRERTAGVSVSNRGGWHSETNLHLLDDDRARALAAALIAFSQQALRESYPGREVQARITECWINVAGKGAWHSPHDHFPAHWSGVLYVSARHVRAAAEDDRAGCIELLNPIPLARAFGLPSGIAYEPKDGLILLFPGPIQHLVHPNPSDEDRISIAFNLVVST
jgi:uncharacterized protein (TIGR02466 family)